MSETTLENGLKLHYISEGEGPTLLLINGMSHRPVHWEPVSAKLKDRFRVIRFSNRGLPPSGDLSAPYTVDVMAQDGADLMASLGIEAYHVAGISLGGFAAQRLAIKYPDRVKKLILIGTSAGGSSHVRPDQEVLTYFATFGSMEREEAIRKGLVLSMAREWHRDQPDQVAYWVEQAIRAVVPPQVVGRQGMAGLMFDNTGDVGAIAVPTLVIHGDQDRIVPPENGRHLHEKIQNSELVILSESGHVCTIDQAERVAEAMGAFLLK